MEKRTVAPTRTTGPTESPPRLRFHVLKHAKMLMLFNIMPIACSIYLYWQWRVGNITFKTVSEESRTTGIAVIVAGISFAVVCWFMMPVANWLRDYPTWHLRRSSPLVWLAPTIGGWMLWAVMGIAGILAGAVAVFVCVLGIWRLFRLAGA